MSVNNRMNKAQFVREVSKRTGMSIRSTENLINSALDVIVESVSDGTAITIPGFGSFSKVKRAARQGYDPCSQVPITIPEKERPVFKAGKKFKTQVETRPNPTHF